MEDVISRELCHWGSMFVIGVCLGVLCVSMKEMLCFLPYFMPDDICTPCVEHYNLFLVENILCCPWPSATGYLF